MREIEITLKHKITLISLGFIIALMCVEISLRIVGSCYLLYRKGFNTHIRNSLHVYKILCLGDSFTFGVGAGRGGDYPAQLADMLKENKLGTKFEMINEGIGGQNSSELLYFLDSNLDKYKPDMVILMIGMNDMHNTHLHNWALGQRGWYTRLSSWITGLRIYKLYNFAKLPIERLHNRQGSKSGADLSKQDDSAREGLIAYSDASIAATNQEVNSAINEVKELFRSGQDEKAKKLLVETSNKENVWEYINIAKEHNAYGTEEDIIKKVLKTDGTDDWLRFTLGKIYLEQNKLDDAEQTFKFILEDNPNNNYIRFDLAWLYISQKRYNDAEVLLKDAIKVHGGSLAAYRTLFLCYEAQGNKKEADSLRKNIAFYKEITDLNASAIIRKILERGIKIIIMSYPQSNYISEKVTRRVSFIDNAKIFNEFSGRERGRLFSADGHHCNKEGYRIIAENIFNYIKEMRDF